MVTLALAQMFYFLCLRLPQTGGEDGIQGIPRGRLFGFIELGGHPVTMYYVVAAIFLLGFALLHRTIHSPFGQVLTAIRENEPRAISLGYKVNQYKLIAFVLSAALSGLAGGTKALVFQLASLTDVHWSTSGEVILMTLIGGLGTVFGPIAGAVFLVSLENYLSQLGSWVTVTEGAIFVVCVIALRRGMFGELSRILKRPL
jgi:branched-chain amino acid transport system permease protein